MSIWRKNRTSFFGGVLSNTLLVSAALIGLFTLLREEPAMRRYLRIARM
jgi:hypothetical protein